MQVYSPFLRSWLPRLADKHDPLGRAPDPHPNKDLIRSHDTYKKLFWSEVPENVMGFELDAADAKQMRTCWPAGEGVATEMLNRFLYTKSRPSQLGEVDPLAGGAEQAGKNPTKESRIGKYKDSRDKVSADTTSRLRYA